MLFWIITTGEQIPIIDGENIRKWRSYNLTEKLLEKGHDVVRWTSTFDHSQKTHRFAKNTEIKISEKYIVRLVHGCGYTKNISFKRLRDHRQIAEQFMAWTKKVQKPDLILCSFPTIELSEKATKYGIENNIPVILDVRDLWPDIFIEFCPKYIHGIAKLLLYPLFFKTKKAFKNATSLVGITKGIVAWGWQKKNINKSEGNFKVFPLGYKPFIYENQDVNIENFAKVLGKPFDTQLTYVCFIGTMGKMVNFEIINDLETLITINNLKIHLLMCGDGEMLKLIPDSLRKSPNITFTGWIGAKEISNVLNFSKIGFLPYFQREDFLLSIPNKVAEYMSAGLPIISTLGGEVAKLLKEESIGYFETDPIKILERIVFLTNNEYEYLRYSTQSREKFISIFDANTIYDKMAEFLILYSNK